MKTARSCYVAGDHYYVDPNAGDDAGPGSCPRSAFRSWRALRKALDGRLRERHLFIHVLADMSEPLDGAWPFGTTFVGGSH